jgi:hypothetical protein
MCLLTQNDEHAMFEYPPLAKPSQISSTFLARLGLRQTAGGLTLVDHGTLDRIDGADVFGDLALIVAAMYSPMTNMRHHQTVRLSHLVFRCMDMSGDEASLVWALADPSFEPLERTAVAFHGVLLMALQRMRLQRLFSSSTAGEHHRSICPAAYNEYTGEVDPAEMAQWRADFRAMAPEQQMMAATLVWLYQSGSDSTWLRRVPCTWFALDALHYLRDADCISLWLQLIATYPGW